MREISYVMVCDSKAERISRSIQDIFALTDSEEIINSEVYGERVDNNSKTYYEMDYVVTTYPMGNNPQYILHSDIVGVLFQGYSDDQRVTFLNNISSIIEGGL